MKKVGSRRRRRPAFLLLCVAAAACGKFGGDDAPIPPASDGGTADARDGDIPTTVDRDTGDARGKEAGKPPWQGCGLTPLTTSFDADDGRLGLYSSGPGTSVTIANGDLNASAAVPAGSHAEEAYAVNDLPAVLDCLRLETHFTVAAIEAGSSVSIAGITWKTDTSSPATSILFGLVSVSGGVELRISQQNDVADPEDLTSATITTGQEYDLVFELHIVGQALTVAASLDGRDLVPKPPSIATTRLSSIVFGVQYAGPGTHASYAFHDLAIQ